MMLMVAQLRALGRAGVCADPVKADSDMLGP
jgi:hypothetical protein